MGLRERMDDLRLKEVEPVTKSAYHRQFVETARNRLDKQTFDALHHTARSSAGGKAPRGRAVAYRLDKESFPDGQTADAWMQDRIGEVPERIDGEVEWVYPVADDWGALLTTPRAVGEGALLEWHRPSDLAPPDDETQAALAGMESVEKSIFKRLWTAITGRQVVEKSSPAMGEVHIPQPLGKQSTAPKKKPKKKKPLAVVAVDKSTWADVAESLALMDGIENRGFAVHLGDHRTPGALAFAVHARDQATIPHDLGLGIPLPDGVARRVFISKSAASAGHVGGIDFLLAEAKRVADPVRGEIVTDFPLPRDLVPKRVDLVPTHVDDLVPASGLEVVERIEKHSPKTPAIPLEERVKGITWERRVLVEKSLSKTSPIAGINPTKQIIYAPVLVPNEIHDSFDYMTPADIEYTAHNYLTHGRMVCGTHGGNVINADVVESFIAPTDLYFDGSGSPYGPQMIPKGSWVAGIKVNDNSEWEKIMRGEYTGFSAGGYAPEDRPFEYD